MEGSSSETYVVVVGSGAIGLTAALAARYEGASVIVLEKADYFGGTAAVSGGMVWVPMNRYMRELGIDDDRADALHYLEALTAGRTDASMLASLVDRGAETLAFVNDVAGVRFVAMANFPDYHPEWDGAHGGGRSFGLVLYDASPLGDLFESLRPDHRLPFTMVEYEEWSSFTKFPWDELAERAEQRVVARGRALVAPIFHACAEAGVALVTGAAVERLVEQNSRITGVVMADGRPIVASSGVIIACGGFESSAEMKANFSRHRSTPCAPRPIAPATASGWRRRSGPRSRTCRRRGGFRCCCYPATRSTGSPPEHCCASSALAPLDHRQPRGSALRQRGSQLQRHGEGVPCLRPPGLHVREPARLSHFRLSPSGEIWLPHPSRRSADPGWLASADTLEQLAGRIGIDAAGLLSTVETFNRHAREGCDPEFHRGESAYDRYWGDRDAEHPALGPVETGPFYAVEVKSGAFGTKEEIVTDGDGRALDAFDEAIDGLFAVGNTTAHPMGPGYPGAGGTLGPGCTCGQAALARGGDEIAAVAGGTTA